MHPLRVEDLTHNQGWGEQTPGPIELAFIAQDIQFIGVLIWSYLDTVTTAGFDPSGLS